MQRHQEIKSRNDYIKTLNVFLSSSKGFLGETLQKLNWTESATVAKSNLKSLVSCPLNAGHRVSSGNLDKHVELCRWHQQGYRDDTLPFPSPPKKLPVSAVVIDKDLQKDILLKAALKNPLIKIGENVHHREVPQTSDRFFSDFTMDERRILYDYVVSKTSGVMPQLKEFNVTMKPEGQSAPMTREQQMAAERDAKRRRVKHRSAKVHTKSKNYSEVLREVIKNQMEAYEDWIKEHFGNSVPLELDEPENKNKEDVKQENKEMIWLDWDFRSNPHTRWKYVLEKEKRRKERIETFVERSEKNHEKEIKKNSHERKRGSVEQEKISHERKRDREESNSRRHHHKEDFRRTDEKQRRYEDRHEATHSEGRRNESVMKEDHYLRHRKTKNEDYHLTTGRHRSDRYEKEYKSKYREMNELNYESKYKSKYNESFYDCNRKGPGRSLDYCRGESSDWLNETKQGFRIKEENVGNFHNYSYRSSNRSNDSVQLKTEGCAMLESDSVSDSSQSSSSRDSKSVKKGKSSKKHKQTYTYSSSNRYNDSVKIRTEDSGSVKSDSASYSSQSSISSDFRRVKKQKKSKKKHKHKYKKKHRK